jgi:hypothetical protein
MNDWLARFWGIGALVCIVGTIASLVAGEWLTAMVCAGPVLFAVGEWSRHARRM